MIVPLHDLVLIRTGETPAGEGLLYAAFSASAGTEGEVVALGAICGKSEAQGVKKGSRVIFDKGKAHGCGKDNPGLYLVCEDDIRCILAKDEDETAN